MSRIKGRDTAPEKKVRSVLYGLGYRFRICRSDLPGKPDIVLSKHKTVIFVHGCFWHRHPGCKYAYTPKTRQDFWIEKFSQNMKRDEKVEGELNDLGWKVIVIWECEIADKKNLEERLTLLLNRAQDK
ncbi:MAG: very short patch repair endonuclease [Candidatus Xenobiia bacterium LiM19]